LIVRCQRENTKGGGERRIAYAYINRVGEGHRCLVWGQTQENKSPTQKGSELEEKKTSKGRQNWVRADETLTISEGKNWNAKPTQKTYLILSRLQREKGKQGRRKSIEVLSHKYATNKQTSKLRRRSQTERRTQANKKRSTESDSCQGWEADCGRSAGGLRETRVNGT